MEKEYLKKANIKKEFLKDTDFPKSSYYYLNSKEEVASNKRRRGRKNNNLIFNRRLERFFTKEELLTQYIIPILSAEFVSYG